MLSSYTILLIGLKYFTLTSSRRTIGAGLVMLASTLPALGQNETANWLFGPIAGITFKSGDPQKIPEGIRSALSVRAIISDVKGNLLFYTDGHKVWDRTHREMPHDIHIEGSGGSSCQIVPKPGDPNRYYIFNTVGNGWGAPFTAARYSEVDMCLNNGLGDVVEATKNTRLVSVAGQRSATVKHSNGIDYWIAFHEWQSNAFYCYLVTANGVNPTPVISNIGTVLSLTANSTGDGGQMKFSPDGKKLAHSISQREIVEVFDFNNQTGQLSNLLQIPDLNNKILDYTEGVEFSPNGQQLYITRHWHHASSILQYDLSAGDNNAILDTRTLLAGNTEDNSNEPNFSYFASLQLGLDGKIYVTQTNVVAFAFTTIGLGIISRPNEKELASSFQKDVITWDYELIFPNLFAFPTFSASYFVDGPRIQNTFDCISPTVQFSLYYAYSKSPDDVSEIHWSFDDLTSGIFNESDEIIPSHTFISDGPHEISATVTWKDGTTQQLKQQLSIPFDVVHQNLARLSNDTTLCAGATLRLDASSLGDDINWQDGSSESYFDVSSPGVYWAHSCKAGCSFTDSVIVSMDYYPHFLGHDTTVCEFKELTLDVQSFDDVIGWQDNSSSPIYTVTKPGTYWVKVLKNNCVFIDSLAITFCKESDPNLFIPNVITPNDDLHNDRFEIQGIIGDWSLTVYNRYGSVVYHSDAYQNNWSGGNLTTGMYYYDLKHRSSATKYKGWVEIRR